MSLFIVPVKEITSARKAALLAAEFIQSEMEEYRGATAYNREGVCNAFNVLRYAVYNSGTSPYSSTRERQLNVIRRAEDKFTELFRPYFAHGYWMGEEKTNAQQKRRIMALLTTAELV